MANSIQPNSIQPNSTRPKSTRRLPLVVISGRAHYAVAEQVARELNVSLAPSQVETFADGELRVLIDAPLRDAAVYIVEPTSPPVNEHLMGLALLIDAARAAGAARVTAIVPYFGYARQEQRGRVGEPRSAQVVARLLHAVGLDHLVTLDLHSPALESAFSMPVTALRAEELFLPRIKAWGAGELVVVAPDAGALKRAQRYASVLDAGLAAVTKARPRPDRAEALQILGEVRGRASLIVDDMVSTGDTLIGAAEALRAAGAREVHAVFTHAVLTADAVQRLEATPFGHMMTSDTIPRDLHPRIEVVPIAPLVAQAVRDLEKAADV